MKNAKKKRHIIISKLLNHIVISGCIISLLFVMFSGRLPDDSKSFLLSKNSLFLNINVNTNIDCFTCNYQSNLADTIAATDNEPENLIYFDGIQLAIPINFIDCHNEIMNSELRDMLNADDYPHIFVKINNFEISKITSEISKAEINLSIDGIVKYYNVEVMNYNYKNKMFLKGNFAVNLNDFYIKPPSKFWGLIKVDHVININFALAFKIN